MPPQAIRRVFRRPSARLILAAAVAVVVVERGSTGPSIQAQVNPIPAENALTGNSSTEWDLIGASDPSIQGFATNISVNTGETVDFKIQTPSTSYQIDIYRLGYYGGAGARKITTLGLFTQPQNQGVACATDPATGLFDCGNWAVSASWNTSTTGATTGIYLAKLQRLDISTTAASHIVFIVRDDNRKADVVLQTSDTTWQAYNRYGGGSLYCNGPLSNLGTVYASSCAGRAAKVSYNRPMDTRAHDPQSFVFNAEYPMVRWLEANGYDVKYISGVDTERHAPDLVGAKKPLAFLSVGHDEYWSAAQRASVEAARDAGVNLAFFSGNEMYWKTRWETSIDGTSTPFRTLVSYKDTLGGVKLDPMPGVSTGTWRDARFGPPAADSGRPENGLTGTIWTVNAGTSQISVPASMATLRFWRNTSVASLTSGAATLGVGTLGYEWNEDLDNGSRPAGLIHLSSTTVPGVEKILDYGEAVGIGTATHNLTLYRRANGALVFSAGTVQWSWGLDVNHDRRPPLAAPDLAMQQATLNLLADMGAQPATRQIGLIGSSASTDTSAPTSVVTSPLSGATVGSGNPVTITGTAADSNIDGVVAAVEVSVDGGTTWHTAQGTTSWSYAWSPGLPGSVTIRSRAVDDSGNQETPGAGTSVLVAVGSCPCTSLWTASTTPALIDAGDANAVELGLRFHTDINGFVKGVRFYKSPLNTGTHIGNLWTNTGTQLATATFANETPSGWQEVTFNAPVAVTANTTYVVSYHTNVGHYSASGAYFSSQGVDRSPLHALPTGIDGGNGVFLYGGVVFPTKTFNATNYWVDVVLDSGPDSTPPMISDVAAIPIDSSVATITWTTDEASTSRVDYSTSSSLPAAETLSVSDAAFVTAHSVQLTGLTAATSYFFRVQSTDHSGNTASMPSTDPGPPPGPGGGGPPLPPAFTMLGPTLHDTTLADFSAGTLTGDTYAAETGDGELMLAPAIGTEFSGTTMPSGWVTHEWTPNSNGTAVVGGGRLSVDGMRVASCVVSGTACLEQYTMGPDTAVEFVASFTGDPFQHAGLGRTLGVVCGNDGTEPFAIFSTKAGGSLSARTCSGGAGVGEVENDLGGSVLGGMHLFRIDRQASQVVYSVDGAVRATHPVAIQGSMRPVAASDFHVLSGKVVVDWVRASPYTRLGTFDSRVYDALTTVNWQNVSWVANTPPGTTLAISVRTGPTPIPDGSWSSFAAVAPGPIAMQSRYIQYQARMETTNPTQTPVLSDIKISSPALPPTPPPVTPEITWPLPAAITYRTPLGAAQLNATTTAPEGAGTLEYTPGNGEILTAGDHTLSVTFTPTAGANFTTATKSVSITVNKATPTITWNAPLYITSGTALSATQLNASASVGVTSVPGTFAYTPTTGSVLPAGPQTLSVLFTPTDTLNYTTATKSVTITVQIMPIIAWTAPAAILAGTPLSATQLNATVSGGLPGSFVYTPGIGTVLPAGLAQPLSVTFTPTDAVHYATATTTVPITVLPMITATDLSITEGNVTGATKQAWITFKLAQKSNAWVTVNYSTAEGTAKKDVDYYTVSGAAFFAPGVLTQSVAIPIVQDEVGESTESFFVDFSGVVNGVVGQGRVTITIVNDDSSYQVTSSIADFSAGTLAGGAYLSETTNGELMLAPQGSEFSGTSLPAGWNPSTTGGSATVANGALLINGASLLSPAEVGAGQTLEFTASFSASPDQRIGLSKTGALGSPMAMFIVRSSDLQLYVRSINGTKTGEDPIAGIDWLGKPHRYQIVWSAGTVQYYVDGTLMVSHTNMAWGTVTMRPAIVDSTAADAALSVDWIRMTPYVTSGTFTSAVFDAAENVLWQKVTTTSTIPSGTTMTITYRKGNSPTPDDGTWTAFTAVASDGKLAGTTRYMQFKIQISTSSGAKSPVIQDVTIQYKR